MKFDVVIGNPPYQENTAGSIDAQATPVYDKMVKEAKKISSQYLSLIMPSRWMNGGFGLDNFRKEMIEDTHLRVLYDYIDARDCFSGVSITGGVCHFLRDISYNGLCNIHTFYNNKEKISNRYLQEKGLDTFIRFYEGLTILNKVKKLNEKSFSDIVSPRDPFGLNYYEDGHEKMFKLFYKQKKNEDDVKIYAFGWQTSGINYTEKKYITTREDAIYKYKILISKANGAASSKIPYSVISQPIVAEPNSICNMSYLLVGPFNTEKETINAQQYIKTKFFRFLVSLLKNTQNALRKVYTFVPMQDFNESWTDEKLYKKYGLTQEEIDFIESMIRPME